MSARLHSQTKAAPSALSSAALYVSDGEISQLLRRADFQASFRALGTHYYRKDDRSRQALVSFLLHFNTPDINGCIKYDTGGILKLMGHYSTSRRDATRPSLESQAGRRGLAVFIADHLLKEWPLLPAGIDADDINPNWRTEFVHRFFAAHPTLARYEDLTCLLVFDEELRPKLGLLAYVSSTCNSRRGTKSWRHLCNALEDGFAQIVGESPRHKPGKRLTSRKRITALALDFWDEWTDLDVKGRWAFAAKYWERSRDCPPELKPNYDTRRALQLMVNADRDARKRINGFRRDCA